MLCGDVPRPARADKPRNGVQIGVNVTQTAHKPAKAGYMLSDFPVILKSGYPSWRGGVRVTWSAQPPGARHVVRRLPEGDACGRVRRPAFGRAGRRRVHGGTAVS